MDGRLKPRRIRRWWRRERLRVAEYRWAIIAADAVVAATLGFISFSQRDPFKDLPAIERAFLTLKLFLFDPGLALPHPLLWSGRIAFVLAGSVTAFASVRTLTSVLSEQTKRLRIRLFFRRHVVVCGAGDAGTRLVRSFADTGIPVVVIESDLVAPGLGDCHAAGAVVLIGNASDDTTLRQAGVHNARYVIAVCADDTTNADIAATVSRDARDPVTCVVRISSPELSELLRDATLRCARPGAFRLEFFNPFEAVGPALYAEYVTDGAPISVIGLGELGSRLVVHAARAGAIDRNTRPKIAVGGPDVQQRLDVLVRRFPALCTAADITVTDEPDAGAITFVCLDDEADTLATALRASRRSTAAVIACTSGSLGLGDLIDTNHERLHHVSIPDRVYRAEVVTETTNETLARAIHEEYVRNELKRAHAVGDNASMKPWDELPESLRESNREQAVGISAKLADVGYAIEPWEDWGAGQLSFTPDEIEQMSRFEHERWWKERERAGWRPGPERDAHKKTSPYLVPYDELTEDVKELDRNTVRGLPGFLAKIGYRITKANTASSRPG